MTVVNEQAWFVKCPRRDWLRVSGRDHRQFLQNMTTADVLALAPGQTVQGLVLNQRAQVLDWMEMWACDDGLEVLMSPGRLNELIEWFSRYIIADDVTLMPVTDEETWMVGGVNALTGLRAPSDAQCRWPDAGRHTTVILGDVSVRVSRVHGLPDGTYWLRVPQNGAPPLDAHLQALGLRRLPSLEFRARCLAWGVPGGGSLTALFANPWELRLDFAIAGAKGCYLGQEVVTRLKTYDKVQRCLMGFASDHNWQTGTAIVTLSGEPAGTILACAPATHGSGVIGLALVKKPLAVPDVYMRGVEGEDAARLQLCDRPFWR